MKVKKVKHISTEKIHKGSEGSTTGCGENTREYPDHWENTNEAINCDKNGCKN